MAKILACVTILVLFLCGCDKPNPNPELLDPVYNDLSKKAEDLKKQAETDKAAVLEAEKEVKAAVPQTHQIEYATKRVNDAKEKARASEQLARYYEVRAENRISRDHTEYLKARSAGKPWPDPAEYQQFLESEKLAAQHSTKWEASARRQEEGYPVASEKKSGEKSAEKPKEKQAEE